MASLINMETTPQEAAEYANPKPSDAPKYPWGLCLNLDDDSLEKLGIDKLPEVGTDMIVLAKATVTSVNESQSEGGEARRSVSLQITDMQLSAAGKNLAERATDALYGKNAG